jgi:hypothetical protein
MATQTTEVLPGVFLTSTTNDAGEATDLCFHGDPEGMVVAYKALMEGLALKSGVSVEQLVRESPPEIRLAN